MLAKSSLETGGQWYVPLPTGQRATESVGRRGGEKLLKQLKTSGEVPTHINVGVNESRPSGAVSVAIDRPVNGAGGNTNAGKAAGL